MAQVYNIGCRYLVCIAQLIIQNEPVLFWLGGEQRAASRASLRKKVSCIVVTLNYMKVVHLQNFSSEGSCWLRNHMNKELFVRS